MRTRVFSLNVRGGGGARLSAIASRIESHAPDVVVLSEVKANTISAWTKAMADQGYLYRDWIEPPQDQPDALVVLSRKPFDRVDDTPPFDCRCRTVFLPDSGITLIALHVWTSGSTRAPGGKMIMWEWLRSRIPVISQPWLLIGDLNTGDARDRHPGYRKRFKGEEHFEFLTQRAGTDLWRTHHGDRIEWSWITTRLLRARRDDGFRLDHAIGSRDLAATCVRCDYDHEFRGFDHEGKRFALTDHSAIIVDLDRGSTRTSQNREHWVLRSASIPPSLPFIR